MRVSTQQQYNNYSSNIRRSQLRYLESQQEATTGKKADLFAKDPAGGAFVLRASSLKAAIGQYQSNLRTAKDTLNTTEAALGELNELLKIAQTKALQGANSTLDQNAMNALASEIGELQKRLLQVANTQGGSGQYVFGGQKNDAIPFSVAAGALNYAGDGNNVIVETAANQSMVVNSQGQTLFTNAYSTLEQLKLNLQSGNVAQIGGTSVAAVQQSLDAAKQARGDVGAKLKTVQSLQDANQRASDDLVGRIADVEEVDLAEAILNMQLSQTAYQAALQSAVSGFKLSLMDFIQS